MQPRPIPILMDEILAEPEAGFGALATPLGNLPLKTVEVHTRIDGLNFRTILRQTFCNAHTQPLEATYIFPMPDRAAVSEFRLRVAGRTVEGQLRERGEARQIYEDALKKGHRAGIAEEDRSSVFTMRVGNLPAGEDAVVELVMSGALAIDHGEATFRFPLVVAPRYIPGRPLDGEMAGDGTEPDTDAVPDASRITPPVLLPGQPNPVRLEVRVDVFSGGLPARDFRASLHTVQEEELPGGRRFRLQPGERLDRDFVFRFTFDDAQFRTSVQLQHDAGDETQGVFAVTIVPPEGSAPACKPRSVAFVLDRSGSMSGWKMTCSKRALARMIDSLTDQDRFAIFAFDDAIEAFLENGEAQTAGDRQRFRALEWLAKLDARNGTELAAPLAAASELLAKKESAERDRVLVLLTDGQIGNEDQILRSLASKLKGIRVFTLGIDQAVNEGFLKRLAGLGGGYCEVVESDDRLDQVMDKVHRRIRSPLLTGVKLEADWDLTDLVPDRVPDLFPGTPVTIMGRYSRTARSAGKDLFVRAVDEAGRPWSAEARTQPAEVLAPVWARGFVRALEDRYAIGGRDQDKLEKQIVATSLKYSVLCRFTAFVAVDVQEVVNPGGQVQRIVQPVDAAAGWNMGKVYSGAAPVAGTGRGMALRRFALSAGPVDSCLMEADEPLRTMAMPDDLARAVRHQRLRKPTDKRRAASDAGADLSAYRQRAEELCQRLEKATDRLRELGIFAQKLEELIDDLTSIGAAETDRKPLEDLLTELRAFLAHQDPAEDDIRAMGARCHDVLHGFTSGKPSPRKAFWK